MTDEQVRQLAEDIYRHCVLGLDAVGLSMSEPQIELLERLVVAKWVKRNLTEPFYDPTGNMIYIRRIFG